MAYGRDHFLQQIDAVLQSKLSHINARSVMRRGLRQMGVSEAAFKRPMTERFARAVGPALGLFLSPKDVEVVTTALLELQPGHARMPEKVEMVISSENDMTSIRDQARGMCVTMGAGPFATQRLLTAVSELTRNMLNYAGGGVLTVTPFKDPTRIAILAVDHGKGIPNLDEIMAGGFKSKTGLGLGLVGTQRMAHHFEIKTGKTGTTVKAEIRL